MISSLSSVLLIESAKAAIGDDVIDLKKIDFAKGTDGKGLDNILVLAGFIINLLLYVAGAAAIIFFIYSGILYISSAGNPDNVKKGQQGLINATIGIIIVVLSFYIVTAIQSYAGLIK